MSDSRQLERKVTNDYFLVYDRETNELIGRVMDLTAEGVRLVCNDSIEPGSKFKAKMEMPQMIDRYRHIDFDLDARWTRKNPQMGWHETGFKITGLSMETYSVIERIIGDWAPKATSNYQKTKK